MEVENIEACKSSFELLRNKSILAILDGDIDFGNLEFEGKDTGIKISMPYLSGPTLCEISTHFGLPVSYGWNGGAQSCWAYLDDLFEHCIKQNRVPDLLAYLFSKGQFVDKLHGQSPKTIEYAYEKIVSNIIGQINGMLYFGGNELVQVGKNFVIRKVGTTISVTAPSVKTIDRDYIKDLSERAMQDMINGNFDSAVTKSRTLLEEVFCYVIEKKGETPSESGDIGNYITK